MNYQEALRITHYELSGGGNRRVRPSIKQCIHMGTIRMKVQVGAAAVMVAICSTVANAQSLKDKEYFASEEKYLAEEVPFTNQRCEANLAAKFDWSTPPKSEERTVNSAHGYCK